MVLWILFGPWLCPLGRGVFTDSLNLFADPACYACDDRSFRFLLGLRSLQCMRAALTLPCMSRARRHDTNAETRHHNVLCTHSSHAEPGTRTHACHRLVNECMHAMSTRSSQPAMRVLGTDFGGKRGGYMLRRETSRDVARCCGERHRELWRRETWRDLA